MEKSKIFYVICDCDGDIERFETSKQALEYVRVNSLYAELNDVWLETREYLKNSDGTYSEYQTWDYDKLTYRNVDYMLGESQT